MQIAFIFLYFGLVIESIEFIYSDETLRQTTLTHANQIYIINVYISF